MWHRTQVREALATLYKPDRLGDADAQARRVANVEEELASEGHCCLASRHESCTSRALWARIEDGQFVVYQSER